MRDKPILTFSLIILLSAFGLNACNNRLDRVEAAGEPDSVADRQNILTEDEKDFATYASEMHVGEIDMAKQAKEKSTNDDVRDYAEAVIRTHSDALKDLSHSLGPQSKAASWDTQNHVEFLATLSGAQFDQQFISLMIADHRSANDTFRKEINTTQNRDMKNYLMEALPGLEKGLKAGQEVQSKLTGPRTTN